ncbi:MAG: DUF3048 domain-containing protein [Lachnospiraceae bacterium]|nr:DUF3048 domain-containing protein [Lachnospiraceae bacterium]
MKKIKVMLLLAVSTAVLAFGCGKKEEEPAPEPVVEEVTEQPLEEIQTDVAEEEEVDPNRVEPPAGKKFSTLTGEVIEKDVYGTRPIAIMLPTDKAAQPQYGIGRAGVLYECMEEGDMSRQMAIIEDWQGIETLGNVRSCRDYYVYWAMEWDPILVHFGGPYYLASVTTRDDVHNITGCAVNSTNSAPGSNAFYRTTDKVVPHNAYTSGKKLTEQCENLGYSLEHDWSNFTAEHFLFNRTGGNDLSSAAGSFEATDISLSKAFPYTKSSLHYDPESGLYKKDLYESKQIDGTTGEQLTFENVIIQFAHYEVRDAKGYLAFQDHDNTHDGYYITKGKAVHVLWNKTGDFVPTRFYYDDLSLVDMNPGKTYIAVVQDDRTVNINGTDYECKNK